jgi:hypothetical protein
MRRVLQICASFCAAGACLLGLCAAQEIRVPASVTAGEETSISTAGSGKATFYLVGPGISQKSDVSLGQEIPVSGKDLRYAGNYLAVVCASSCQSATFYVAGAKPANLTFLVHPSRVPVAQSDAVSGIALPLDQFHNLVLAPMDVSFQLNAGSASVLSRSVTTHDGVAWFRAASGKSAGILQVIAEIGDVSVRRAVQQVASDPCNLRITGQRTANGVLAQTEPIHDCAGNIVPDGTIVTFTARDVNGKDTVDAPVKQGIAKAQMAASGPVTISAASGVVLGNELRLEAQR